MLISQPCRAMDPHVGSGGQGRGWAERHPWEPLDGTKQAPQRVSPALRSGRETRTGGRGSHGDSQREKQSPGREGRQEATFSVSPSFPLPGSWLRRGPRDHDQVGALLCGTHRTQKSRSALSNGLLQRKEGEQNQ